MGEIKRSLPGERARPEEWCQVGLGEEGRGGKSAEARSPR